MWFCFAGAETLSFQWLQVKKLLFCPEIRPCLEAARMKPYFLPSFLIPFRASEATGETGLQINVSRVCLAHFI